MVRSLCLWTACTLPVLVGLWQLHGVPSFRDDTGMLRALALLPVGVEGAATTFVSQLLVLVPLGTQSLRVALLGVFSLGICGALLFRLAELTLVHRLPKVYAPLLALFASGLFTLYPGALVGALQVGGPLPALALALLHGYLVLSPHGSTLPHERSVLAGLLAGLLIAESPALGVLGALLGVPALLRLGSDRRWRPLVAAAFALLLATLPLWLRPLAPGGGPNLAIDGAPRMVGFQWTEPGQAIAGTFEYGASQLGLIACLLGVWGWCVGVAQVVVARLRHKPAGDLGRLLWLSTLLVVGTGSGARCQEGLVSDAPQALALAGLATWCLFAAQGLAALLLASIRARLAFKRGAFALTLAFAFTLVLRGPDRLSSRVLSGDASLAWTEEALGRLPPSSLLLVSSPQQAHRLIAAQRIAGMRPDVLIVPAERMLGDLTADLVQREPELAPLLRQLAVNGVADEYSLCRLADARPLFVQLDPDWDPKLFDHLRPDGLWLGFSPHALGRTDRNQGLHRAAKAFERLLRLPTENQLDEATRQVLVQAAEEQVLVLAAVGDREGVQGALAILEQLDPLSPLLLELPAQLEESSGRIAIADLARLGSSHLNP